MRDSQSNIFRYVLLGFAITALLVTGKILFEHTSWGHKAELFAFQLLQGQLLPFNPQKALPVVVDTSKIEEGKDKEVVDLEQLKEAVIAIAAQKPRVIGIDIVLTPEREEDSEDEHNSSNSLQKKIEANYFNFLDTCLQITKDDGIPIFIAVGKRTVAEPKDWLGDEKYKEMATTVIIPKEDSSRIPVWFKTNSSDSRLYSLSAALAKAYQKNRLPNGFAWAVQSEDEEFPSTKRYLEENMEYADALVNYSKLEAIQEARAYTVSKTSIKESGEKFRDRMVILGDGTKEKKVIDTFVVPGRGGTIPGVFLHASAAYTFAREPMYEFTFWVRLLLDFLLSAIIIFWVAIARYKHLDKRKIFHWHKFQNWLVLVFVVVVCMLAFLLVLYTGILWLDFLLVMLALWIHPKIERKFTNNVN